MSKLSINMQLSFLIWTITVFVSLKILAPVAHPVLHVQCTLALVFPVVLRAVVMVLALAQILVVAMVAILVPIVMRPPCVLAFFPRLVQFVVATELALPITLVIACLQSMVDQLANLLLATAWRHPFPTSAVAEALVLAWTPVNVLLATLVPHVNTLFAVV